MKIKAETPGKFTKEMQETLSDLTVQVVDLEEQIELADDDVQSPESTAESKKTEQATENGYKPAPGTEKLVHLSIVRGRRFDENTGKEISTPYIQKFTYGEYQNFIKNASLVGYTIVEELYNPFKK